MLTCSVRRDTMRLPARAWIRVPCVGFAPQVDVDPTELYTTEIATRFGEARWDMWY
jgi:hypothetical protein